MQVIPAIDDEENKHPVSLNRFNIDLPPNPNEETEENVERSNPSACRAVSDGTKNRSSIKKGMVIEYANNDKWVSAEIVSRAGRARLSWCSQRIRKLRDPQLVRKHCLL